MFAVNRFVQLVIASLVVLASSDQLWPDELRNAQSWTFEQASYISLV